MILGSDFRDELFIIPVVLFANIGNGIVFNLSFWYKRTGKTRLAILVTGSGLICTIVFNLLLLPRLGYAGTAWAHLGSEWIMVIVSYILSRIYYPVPYPILSFRRYIILFFGSMAKGYILDRKYIVQSLFDCNLYRGSSEG